MGAASLAPAVALAPPSPALPPPAQPRRRWGPCSLQIQLLPPEPPALAGRTGALTHKDTPFKIRAVTISTNFIQVNIMGYRGKCFK